MLLNDVDSDLPHAELCVERQRDVWYPSGVIHELVLEELCLEISDLVWEAQMQETLMQRLDRISMGLITLNC